MKHDTDAVVAVGTRVGKFVNSDSREHPLRGCTERDRDRHRMPRGRNSELVLSRELILHRPPGCQHSEGHEVFGEELLFAAKASADASRKHTHPRRIETENVAELVAHQKRNLAGRAHNKAAGLIEPPASGVGFEGRVRDPRSAPRARNDRGGGSESRIDIAAFAVKLGHSVAGCVRNS